MSDETIEQLRRRIADLEERSTELDDRNLELEREIARRGVKLSCANIALARAKIAFDEQSRHREEAIQDIAHDLRTPLTSIKGAVRNVLDGIAGPIDEPVREYLEIVGDQSERLIGVVNWLVQAIRITSQPLEREDDEVDLGQLVCRVVTSLRPIAEEKGLELRVEAPRVRVWVDPGKIHQILDNLIGNALKFTTQGSVSVVLRPEARGTRIDIRDTGEGMSEEALEKIFHRYYRASPDQAGSGLGLLIARELARLHGGDISVKSALGEGSCFSLFLPHDAADTAADGDVAPPLTSVG